MSAALELNFPGALAATPTNLLFLLITPLPAAGWTPQNILKGASDRDRNVSMYKMNSTLRNIMDKVRLHETAWPFQDAVDKTQVGLSALLH